ncbi:MAG TPA: hypothetical protein VEA38_16720 [Terriglobales bacterium]|nr:hypothetical protein [Terriglobales bacterium]
MVGLAIFAVVVGVLVVAPLALRAWVDRMSDRALAIRAEIGAVMRQELHGDSLLGLQVVPEAPWRTGRVEVSVPRGWDPVLVEVSEPILAHVPTGYELVVQHPDAEPVAAAA